MASDLRVDLLAAEVELLLKACRKYRNTLPAYLQATQPEIALLDAIVAKLKASAGSD